jgi:hypothetical protein
MEWVWIILFGIGILYVIDLLNNVIENLWIK